MKSTQVLVDIENTVTLLDNPWKDEGTGQERRVVCITAEIDLHDICCRRKRKSQVGFTGQRASFLPRHYTVFPSGELLLPETLQSCIDLSRLLG